MGRYSGTIKFGPNQLDSTIDEQFVKAYKLYFANANLSTVGPAVATVTAAQVSSSTCGCDSDRYSVTMNRVDIPSGATGFMVVIVDVYDFELPLGTYIGGLVDIWTSTTTTRTTESETSESVTQPPR